VGDPEPMIKRVAGAICDVSFAASTTTRRFCTKLQTVLYNPGDRRPGILTGAVNLHFA
jgi:hypothetical protein